MRKTGGQPAGDAQSGTKPAPPKPVRYAAGALLLSGVAAMLASISLYGQKSWLLKSLQDSNAKLKPADRKSKADLLSQVNHIPTSQVVATAVLLVALLLVAAAAYRGKYFARWAVLGLWVISSLTNTPGGFFSILSIAASSPVVFKAPLFVAGLAFLAAVILTNLRASTEFFNAGRPPRPAGMPARRGLFGAPRAMPPRQADTRPARSTASASPTVTPSSATPPANERAKAKQRASADAVAKGAELARTRAKAASKSRRTGA
jgi:hypothetical protein